MGSVDACRQCAKAPEAATPAYYVGPGMVSALLRYHPLLTLN